MTKKTIRSVDVDPGYRLPETIDPGETVCVKINVPKDTYYLGAFWSQLWHLTHWNAWERDNDKRGKDAAAIWRAAIQESRDLFDESGGVCCEVEDIRQKPDVPCVLQKYTGGEWVDFADMRLCVPKLRLYGGKIQQDTTGDGDWVDASNVGDFDQKNGGEYLPQWETVPEGESAECLSSKNVSELINYTIATFCGTWAGAEGFAAALSFIVGAAAAWLTDGIAGPLFGLITTLALWEFEHFAEAGIMNTVDDMIDLLECLYDETGTMSAENHATLLGRIDNKISGLSVDYEIVRWRFTRFYVQFLGPVGMTLAGKAWGVQSYDCGRVCGCENFDFTQNDGGWECHDGTDWRGSCCAQYGDWWQGVSRNNGSDNITLSYIEISFVTPINISAFQASAWIEQYGTPFDGGYRIYAVYGDTSEETLVSSTDFSDGSHKLSWSGYRTNVVALRCDLECGNITTDSGWKDAVYCEG